MAKMKSSTRKRRPPLDRERILRAAIALADKDGLEGLSMRKLGQSLGVEAMSLYNHVANKEEMLDGIADVLFGAVHIPATTDAWIEPMRQRAISVHEMLVRHPWAIGLLESRKAPGPALLRYAESILDVLRRAGFAPVAAIRAFCVLDSYVYGFSIQQKSLPPDPGSATLAVAEQFLRQLPVHGYPHLAEAASNVMQSGFDFSKEFELGLDLILKALEAWRAGDDATSSAHSHRR